MINKHSYWMNRALVQARKGLGFVHPNPMVGAVVLDENGNKIGEGFHAKHGLDHAEVVALQQAGKKAKGGTLYVTLEPCCHHGKTPPCVDAIIKSGLKNVVVACVDPNPKVFGKGIQALRDAGLHVEVGVCRERAIKMNIAFFHCVQHQKPFVRAKVAMTVDGFIGHKDQRLMLSSSVLERITMRLRAESQAIVVGSHTVMTDNPQLNVRGKYSDRKPIRVIMDSNLQVSPDANLFRQKEGEVWIFCDERKNHSECWKTLSSKATLIPVPIQDGKIPVKTVLEELQKRGITSILIEGGARVVESFVTQNFIQEWIIYLNSNNLRLNFPHEKLVQLNSNPLFSLEFQSVIRRDQDLVITGHPRSLTVQG